jgi:class 3 adenylate cyclase
MSQPTRKLAAIMFTDIVGFTDLTATDEAIALKLLQWQRETFQPLIAEHGGEWLKEIGDGLLLSFASSQDAVRCAIRIQDVVGEVPNLKLRIGIHQGDIVQDGADILGDGVNMASRIEAVAPAGGIAFSEKVQQDIAGYPELETVSLGEYSLKGASRPVTLYCLAPYGLPNIPEYKLLCRTGAGAYGEVWLAQTLTGIYRAVKIVRRSQFEDERPYEREFKGITEYEPVSRKSDGLIDLLHVGSSEADDFFYYVMELADGQRPSAEINVASYQPKTLQSELESRGRLSIEECLKHGSHLARALAFLHGQNLVHRDIKPANIVFVNGQPKLADIGLVTTMDNASTLVGTMGYIPPEGPGKPSSDIYALGMVLYELGTGKDRADFPEIDVMDPALKGLNQVCLKACSNDLSERFSDANALADELDRLTHEPLGGTTATSTSGGFGREPYSDSGAGFVARPRGVSS